MRVNLGNIVSISTIDWYGKCTCTIFFNGCNFRCPYCQNCRLLTGNRLVDIEKIKDYLYDIKTFINAVVFSGGEPTMQPDPLITLAEFAKRQGLLVGIETNGYYSDVLDRLVKKKLLDKIFLDIKVSPLNHEKYEMLTAGPSDVSERVMQSLNIPDIDIEIRTTIFRSINDSSNIARFLYRYNSYHNRHNRREKYILQQGIPWNAPDEKIRKEDPFTRKEMIYIARDIANSFEGIKIKIRTRERGEEDIIVK